MRLDHKDAELFARLNSNEPHLRTFLEAVRVKSIDYLVAATDPVLIHRAQGRIAFVDEITSALTDAQKLLTQGRK